MTEEKHAAVLYKYHNTSELQMCCRCGWRSPRFSDLDILTNRGLELRLKMAYEQHLREKPYYGFLII